jgi:hypothetical protein
MEHASKPAEIDPNVRAAAVVMSITGSLLVVVGLAFVGRSAFI